MTGARLLSLLVVGAVIAWLIGRAIAGLEDGWLEALPWLALIFAVAIGYAFGFDRFIRRRR